jgi:hypothetical protein
MRQLPLWVGVVLFAVIAPTQRARAADEPLLVVVEAKPGADVAPADIRAALREELKGPVLSPEDAKASEATRLLVVTLDGPTIRVSLRDSPSELVTRTVAAPVGQSERLRTITWLAGNLARDQVTGIVDGPAPSSTAAHAPPRASASPAGTPALPATAVAQPVQPPPVTPVAPTSSAPADSISVTSSSATSNRASEWAVTVSAGRLLVPFPDGPSFSADAIGAAGPGSAYELRVQRPLDNHDFNLSLAVDIGQLVSGRFIGMAGLVGKHWDYRHWFVELATGVGVEVAKARTETTRRTVSSVSGVESMLVIVYEEQPGVFVTGRGALGVPLSASLDALAELGVLVGSLGYKTDFLSTTVGLRLRIP